MGRSLDIFVVDDDRDVAEGLADVLEMSGHRVTLAHSGAEAVELFSKQNFDIAFMDVMMPGMNGVESFIEIRKVKPHAKVIMMTGYSVEQLLQQAVDNGAVGILHKPVAMESVTEALENVKDSKGMVLVADDDPDFCDSIRETLESRNFTTCVAANGQEALDRVLAGGIDVLVLDIHMPVINGVEVYIELQKRGCKVPTVVVSGCSKDESSEVSALRDMSVTGILVKPFNPIDLLDTLDNLAKEAA